MVGYRHRLCSGQHCHELTCTRTNAPVHLHFEQAKEELTKGKDLHWKFTWGLQTSSLGKLCLLFSLSLSFCFLLFVFLLVFFCLKEQAVVVTAGIQLFFFLVADTTKFFLVPCFGFKIKLLLIIH